MEMERFGIFSPVLGKREDIPSLILPAGFTEDNNNVILIDREIHRAKKPRKELISAGETPVQSPDANPFLHFHFFEKDNGTTKYLLGFTKDNIYCWYRSGLVGPDVFTGSGLDDATSGGTYTGSTEKDFRVQIDGTGTPNTFKWSNDGGVTWEASTVNITGAAQTLEDGVTITFAATTGHTLTDRWDFFATFAGAWNGIYNCTECEDWSVVTYNDLCLATNNVDKVLYWDGTGDFDNLGSASGLQYDTGKYITSAKQIMVFENYCILGHFTADGTVYPSGIIWCAIGDHTNWITGDSGSATVPDPNQLTGYGFYQDYLIIFKERSFYRVFLVASDLIFNIVNMSTIIGTYAPHSIVNGSRGELCFFASDFTIREIRGSLGDYPDISAPIHKTIRDIPDSYVSEIKSIYIARYQETQWAIPSGAGAEQNNTIIAYKDAVWKIHDTEVSAFGTYERAVGYTIDTIPYPTIDSIAWETIDSVEVNAGFRPDICSDYDGYVYALYGNEYDGDSTAYEGYFVLATNFTTDNTADIYKRLLWLKLYFRGERTGEADIYIKSDYEEEWQSLGSVDLESDNEIIMLHHPCSVRGKTFLLKISGENPFRFLGVIFGYQMGGQR